MRERNRIFQALSALRRVEGRPPSPEPATVRRIAQGEVVGFRAENGAHVCAHVWRGLPYAASTAGANRWRAPRPAPAWEGRRLALVHAARCAQVTTHMDRSEGLPPGRVVGSEDCLALDIYAPAEAAGAADAASGALPVMVWIHGGFNSWGRSGTYDGSLLAEREHVVVVAVQYRLGPLGWFSHPALREGARTPEDACACFATLDLIAALTWVRENVAVFGGNPDNVTIVGQSAGGHNVVTLLASPLARGLFHRAIVQSGSFDSVSVAEAEGDAGNLRNPSKVVAEKLGAATAEALRAVPVERLLGAYSTSAGFLNVPCPVEDGVVLPARPLRDAFASAGTFNAVPILMGTNRDEMKLFYFRDHRMTRRRLGLLVVARDQDLYDAVSGYMSRLWRIRAVNEPAALMARAGHNAVYTYRFDWDDCGRVLLMDLKVLVGAAHGLEIPFLFGRFDHLGAAGRVLFTRATLADREALGRAMGAYWASFARDGVPSCQGAPAWPAHGTDGGSSMRFDGARDGGLQVVTDRDSIDALVADVKADGRLNDAGRRRLLDEVRRWMFARPARARIEAALGGG